MPALLWSNQPCKIGSRTARLFAIIPYFSYHYRKYVASCVRIPEVARHRFPPCAVLGNGAAS